MRLLIPGVFILIFTLINLPGNAQVGSLSFNGIDNYVEVPEAPFNRIGRGDFTIEAWIKGEEGRQGLHPTIFSNRRSNAFGTGIMFFLHAAWGSSDVKMLCVQLGSLNLIVIGNGRFNASLLDNTCHHVALTRKGSLISFYADGVLFGTRTQENIVDVDFDGPLWIGQDGPTNNTFEGTISQCRIWSVARTEQELLEAKDISLRGDESDLIAYWEMNEGEGTILKDKTNQYDGVLASDNQAPTWSDDYCVGAYEAPLDPLSICPNPTFDIIAIKNPSGNTIPILLFDVLGRLILKDEINGELDEIDLRSYAGGVYLLQFPYQGKTHVEKIVKQ